ncbi:MAG: formylglycine-generating enzyme family protein, partial [Epibacterium sp.]|nr:formylglycine-generating enzyme family protein [Epibacterium sp.]
MGTKSPHLPDDGEGPLRAARLKPFRMGAKTVTNAEFASFVEDTGYVTEAERFGWSFVFWSEVPPEIEMTQGIEGLEWWRRVDGAYWKAPRGPGSSPDADHPAVHISWNDARAIAAWAGATLPTEAQWEHAARGGLEDVPFPWGDAEPDDSTFCPCNIWQGEFPKVNTAVDGYLSTAPARSFAPN